jgi:hypothetical protein
MRILFSLLFLLTSSHLVAAEMSLLARYEFSGHRTPGFTITPPNAPPPPLQPATPHLFMAFTSGAVTRTEIPATPENVGKTFNVAPSTLALVQENLTGPGSVGFGARIGISEPYYGNVTPAYYFDANEVFTNARFGSSVRSEAFVPQLGPNFSGYSIDALTITVGHNMIIQIYGQAIPEPTFPVTLLTCTALVPLVRMRRRSIQ